jgi:hypothetical protein
MRLVHRHLSMGEAALRLLEEELLALMEGAEREVEGLR